MFDKKFDEEFECLTGVEESWQLAIGSWQTLKATVGRDIQ